jgi:hypothetical protein
VGSKFEARLESPDIKFHVILEGESDVYRRQWEDMCEMMNAAEDRLKVQKKMDRETELVMREGI